VRPSTGRTEHLAAISIACHAESASFRLMLTLLAAIHRHDSDEFYAVRSSNAN
jgi:hypothetical protein